MYSATINFGRKQLRVGLERVPTDLESHRMSLKVMELERLEKVREKLGNFT